MEGERAVAPGVNYTEKKTSEKPKPRKTRRILRKGQKGGQGGLKRRCPITQPSGIVTSEAGGNS